MIRHAILVVFGSVAVSGCQGLSSKRIDAGYVADQHAGFHYSLPRATVHLRYSASDNGERVAVSLVGLGVEPDLDHGYSLRYLPSVTADDNVVVDVDSKRLLKSVDITTDDKTDEIAQKIIQIGKDMAKSSAAAPIAPSSFMRDTKAVLNWEIDPTNMRQLGWVNSSLAQVGLAVDVVDANGNSMASTGARGQGSPSVDCSRSICYRPLEPYRLLVTTTEAPAQVLGVYSLLLPNRAPVLGIDVDRAAFVEKKTRIDFEQGNPTKLTLKKPSQAMAFIEIPLAIVTAVAALPGEIVAANITALTQDTDQLTAQKNRLVMLGELQTEIDRQEKRQATGNSPLGSAQTGCDTVMDPDCVKAAPGAPAQPANAPPPQGAHLPPQNPLFSVGYRPKSAAPNHLRP